MPTIKCSFWQPVDGKFVVYLRCYNTDSCPSNLSHYHNAEVLIGITSNRGIFNTTEKKYPHPYENDLRWPKRCICGYEFNFDSDDCFQVNVSQLYTDGQTELRLSDIPVGGMWYADWMPYRGSDGHCLAVRCPGGDWIPDAGAINSPLVPGWTREGIPPNVTASPSIGQGEGNSRYHGFLRNGELVDA